MFKVMHLGAAPASLSFLSLQVYASSSEKETPKKELLKIDELSLYSCPIRESKYVEEPQTQLEEGISYLRHSVAPYTAWCQFEAVDTIFIQNFRSLPTKAYAPIYLLAYKDLYTNVMPKVERTVERGRESCEFLKNPPPGFYPRLGVIGFAGIVGLFLSRGSKIKRLVYPLSFMGIGASLYYPQQAVAVAKVTGLRLYDWSLQGYVAIESLWKDNPKKKKSGKKISDKSEADSDKPVEVHINSGEERTMK